MLKIIKINKLSLATQQEAYNDFQAFNPLYLAHCQAHDKCVW